MARQPTGTPRGKPKGSGRRTPTQTVAEAQVKVTVWLPIILYDRLEALAVGRHFHRGSSQLARCVREALEEYLDRHRNQPRANIPRASMHKTRQTPKTTAVAHEKERACAYIGVAEAQDLWTEPRAGGRPATGCGAPSTPGGGRAVVNAGSRSTHPALAHGGHDQDRHCRPAQRGARAPARRQGELDDQKGEQRALDRAKEQARAASVPRAIRPTNDPALGREG
jgi:hypothetical protein